ncbi:MAG: low molecular weight phosphotyrosine protein phosphatase [Proteobacteria bacterium]|nr:low molecular weight phosphotyrosine protein phosphatase [Pseudomonadota bacterium]HQR02982.1 low molecular weight protein-tyrosine-phosphatase [Rhodocyclaceae bacterium]
MRRILFVCTGNICRSPTAEGVLRTLAAREGLSSEVEVDSAGTHDYHVGEPPDRRTVKAATRRGYDLSKLRARQVVAADFEHFDWILAMDQGHLKHLQSMASSFSRHKLALFLDCAEGTRGQDVPDPYYGGAEGFETVLDLVEQGAFGLLRTLRAGVTPPG